MIFPETLTVVVRDSETGRPVEGVALVLLLFASQKNDYMVGPAISDASGEVKFTHADCEFTIKKSQEMFIMDYQGDLASCRPVVEVRLHPMDNISRMRQQYETSPVFWGQAFQSPQRLFADLQNVKNADYELARASASEAQLLAGPRLELALHRRTAKG